MRRGTQFDPSFDLTDEERAIIESMVEEDERRKALGIPPNTDLIDSPPTPRSDDERAAISTKIEPAIVSATGRQYFEETENNSRSLKVELQSRTPTEAADQQRLAEMTAIAMIPLMRAAASLPHLHHPNNIEETEAYDDDPVPMLITRQASFYNPSSINPLLLLANQGNCSTPQTSSFKLADSVPRERTGPDISRKAYGFTHSVECEGFSPASVGGCPFCFQWVGEILRASGTLNFSYSTFADPAGLINPYQTCKVCFLSSTALFQVISKSKRKPENSRGGDVSFYLIDKTFLGKPFFTTRVTMFGSDHLIYTINYDEVTGDYYFLFYDSLQLVRSSSPMTYSGMVNSKINLSMVPIDFTVQLTWDPSCDL